MTLQRPWKPFFSITLGSMLMLSNGGLSAIAVSTQHEALAAEMQPNRLTDRQRYLLEAALRSAEQQDSNYSRARSMIRIAAIYQQLGDTTDARTLLNKVTQSEESIEVGNEIRLAAGYLALGDMEKADQRLFNAIVKIPTKKAHLQQNHLASIGALYGQFPEALLVKQRLERLYDLIPNTISDSLFIDYAAPLRGLAIAYGKADDTQVANSGLARVSKLASIHLVSIHTPSSTTDDFFASDDVPELKTAGNNLLVMRSHHEAITNYAFLFGQIASAYRQQGNQTLAQDNLEKALFLKKMLPFSVQNADRGLYLQMKIAEEAHEQGKTDLSQQLVAAVDARIPRDTSEPFYLVSRRTAIAVAYHRLNDKDNANRVLDEVLQDIQSLVDEARSPLAKQNAYHYITDIAQAYAKIGNVAQQQSLLKQNFDALFSIDVSAQTASPKVDTSRIKNQILDDGTRIYSKISDESIAKAQLAKLESLAGESEMDSVRVYNFSDLAIASAKRQSFDEAERLTQVAIQAANLSASTQKDTTGFMIAIADAVSHLSDPAAIRAGLVDIAQMQTRFEQLSNSDDRTQAYKLNLLNRRLMETYLQAL